MKPGDATPSWPALLERLATRAERTAIGEALLVRFLVQNQVLPNGLVVAVDAERQGAGEPMSLIDWMIYRGHLTEGQLVSALAHCLRLDPIGSVTAAAAPAPAITDPASDRKRRRDHLRLVRGRPSSADSRGASSVTARKDRAPRSSLRVLK